MLAFFGSWELEGDVGESEALENDILPPDGGIFTHSTNK